MVAASPPPLPAKATWGDKLKMRSYTDELERRKAENTRVLAERDDWWREGSNEYFTLITDSMVVTAPSLRDLLPTSPPASTAAATQARVDRGP